MNNLTLILTSMLLLLSCKSHKDVSRNVVSEQKVETFTITTDSSMTHRETSLDSEATKREDTNTYTIRTEFDPNNNVVSITETWNNINLQVDFRSRLDEIKREDVKLINVTQTTDTASTVIKEVINETTETGRSSLYMWLIIAAIAIITTMRLITIRWSPY